MTYILYHIGKPYNYYGGPDESVVAIFTSKELCEAYIEKKGLETEVYHRLEELKNVDINPE